MIQNTEKNLLQARAYYNLENYSGCLDNVEKIILAEGKNCEARLYKTLCLLQKILPHELINITVLKSASNAFEKYGDCCSETGFNNEILKKHFIELIEAIYSKTKNAAGGDDFLESLLPLNARLALNSFEDELARRRAFHEFVNVYVILVSMLEDFLKHNKDREILNLLVKFLQDIFGADIIDSERSQYFDKKMLKEYTIKCKKYSEELDNRIIEEFWGDIKSGRRLSFAELNEVYETNTVFFDELTEFYKQENPTYYNTEFSEHLPKIKKIDLVNKNKQRRLFLTLVAVCIVIIIALIIWRY